MGSIVIKWGTRWSSVKTSSPRWRSWTRCWRRRTVTRTASSPSRSSCLPTTRGTLRASSWGKWKISEDCSQYHVGGGKSCQKPKRTQETKGKEKEKKNKCLCDMTKITFVFLQNIIIPRFWHQSKSVIINKRWQPDILLILLFPLSPSYFWIKALNISYQYFRSKRIRFKGFLFFWK